MNGYGHFSDSDVTHAGNFGQGMKQFMDQGNGMMNNGRMHDQRMHDEMMNGYWQDNRTMPDSFPGFVDADGDGICDYAGQHHEPIDIDGDGIPDNPGLMHGFDQCSEFIDEDGDGICDYAEQHHELVDVDGDGIPDNHRFGRGMCGGWSTTA
jgi:hypothetical protein